MVKERLSFSQGTDEYRAYGALTALGFSFASLDNGCHRVSYSSSSAATTFGAGNKVLEACEVWGPLVDQSSRLSSTLTSLFGETPSLTLPTKSTDKSLQGQLKSIDTEIQRLKKKYQGDKKADLKLAQGLYDFVVSLTGLGIQPIDEIRENAPKKVLDLGRANCSEFFALFRSVFNRAGLQVSPVYVFESASGDKSGGHLATAFQYGAKTYLMDPFYDGFDTKHVKWASLTLREYWAWQFNNKGLMAVEAGKIAEAEAYFRNAERLDPNNPWIPNNLGLMLEKAGRKADAKSAYGRASGVDPQFIDAYVNLGALLLNEGKWKEARVPLGKGYLLKANDERVLYNLATAHYELKNYGKALFFIERNIQINSNNSDYYSLRSDIFSKLGRDKEAQKDRVKALRLNAGPSE